MIEADNESRSAARQLLIVVALVVVGYLYTRILRFTSDGFNLAFVCVFLLLPFLAIKPVLRLHRWHKILSSILLAPLLALSFAMLLFTAACDIPAALQHRELMRELSSVAQDRYSVHLLWEETAAGAVGPHGIGLEQRMFIVPGLYVVKHLDYFDGAHSGSLSAEGEGKVMLHIPGENGHSAINRIYALKRRVYF